MLDIFTHSWKFIIAKKTLDRLYLEANSLYFAIFLARENLFRKSFLL